MTDHFVRHMVDADVIHTEYRCEAIEGAPCRSVCQCLKDSQWEEYCQCDEPVMVDLGHCNALLFLSDAPNECFGGEQQPARSGWSPIDLTWEGDYFSWDYAAPASVTPTEGVGSGPVTGVLFGEDGARIETVEWAVRFTAGYRPGEMNPATSESHARQMAGYLSHLGGIVMSRKVVTYTSQWEDHQ